MSNKTQKKMIFQFDVHGMHKSKLSCLASGVAFLIGVALESAK